MGEGTSESQGGQEKELEKVPSERLAEGPGRTPQAAGMSLSRQTEHSTCSTSTQ